MVKKSVFIFLRTQDTESKESKPVDYLAKRPGCVPAGTSTVSQQWFFTSELACRGRGSAVLSSFGICGLRVVDFGRCRGNARFFGASEVPSPEFAVLAIHQLRLETWLRSSEAMVEESC